MQAMISHIMSENINDEVIDEMTRHIKIFCRCLRKWIIISEDQMVPRLLGFHHTTLCDY